MIPVDAHTMREVAPRFSGDLADRQTRIINAVGEVLAATLERYGINNRLRIAHFLGQTCHESAGFRTTEEFASGEAYEGRKDLGNKIKGDGPRYKGRGLLQLTGRDNYKRIGAILEVDLENDPDRAADPVLSLLIACEYWKSRNINSACDADDLLRVTKLVNGGTNGLEDRRQLTSKAKSSLARLEGIAMAGAAPPAGTHSVLRRDSRGDEVEALQRLLRKLGFMIGIDGHFGAGTEVAVAAFQRDHKLTADGIVGKNTWAALDKAS